MRYSLFALLIAALPALAQPHPAAVQVRQHHPDGVIDSGSGTVVASSPEGWALVVTNRHVTPAPGGRIVVRHAGREYPAAWVRTDPVEDLALLAVGAELPAAELADAPPPAGEPVEIWGHPGGVPEPVHKVGLVRGLVGRVQDTGAAVWGTTVGSQSGDSGSGHFWRGRLCGVTWGGRPDVGCSCVSLDGLKRFLGFGR